MTPLNSPQNAALVHDFQKEGWLIYLKDIAYDPQGRPVMLVIRSRGFQSGPRNDPRIWTLVRWTGNEWKICEVARSDHNYDMGSLYIESGTQWRVIAPTAPGPQPYCTGGEVVMWQSRDGGRTWQRTQQLTHNSPRNHTYVRRPLNPHPEFYAFWADGHALKPSISRLYFSTRSGEVRQLPASVEGRFHRF